MTYGPAWARWPRIIIYTSVGASYGVFSLLGLKSLQIKDEVIASISGNDELGQIVEQVLPLGIRLIDLNVSISNIAFPLAAFSALGGLTLLLVLIFSILALFRDIYRFETERAPKIRSILLGALLPALFGISIWAMIVVAKQDIIITDPYFDGSIIKETLSTLFKVHLEYRHYPLLFWTCSFAFATSSLTFIAFLINVRHISIMRAHVRAKEQAWAQRSPNEKTPASPQRDSRIDLI
ncbi:uncharacterized protein L969DRAFT_92655 [Mixia osmundae IAM 14324]|uniref:Uncharacterized protein n=1 Tax=Mixia osmundae (strain CBS 9802 / IAM 14324 / JCM 22182 / KY 12970) TaxID=764103 RepID=G7DY63_MIXOS|nr:uncharacterized protein L969DRAFT_92655 [Mixia osmundae IAM 14324]KEI41425.1 hypothetical protein L969DRAFT_92655 [Mixia osmundae IAM 14324]GAA95523.1 hypothetical protein E5Q_02178 [Mixia osmundae IAM 14324]